MLIIAEIIIMVGFTCVKSMSKPMKVYQVKKCFSKTCIK